MADDEALLTEVAALRERLLESGRSAARLVAEAADETRRVGEALRSSEAYLRALLDSSAEGFYAVDCDGMTTLSNPAFLRMLGFGSEAEIMGRQLHDVIHHSHPDGSHYPAADCPIYRCARDGTPAHVTGELFYCLDGTPLPVEYWAHPIQLDGVLLGAVCTFLDVSERERSAAALRESEARFRELADTISQLAWMADAAGSIVWFNRRWYDYTGTTVDSMQGWGWTSVHHPDHVDGVMEKLKRCFAEGTVWEDTFPLRGADGTFRWFLSRAVPTRGKDGVVERWFGTNTDVTEQLEAEERLRELNDTLEQRVVAEVSERARTEEQLRQSQKMEAVGQLTGGLAHDFNNLLTGISGSLELLQTRIAQGRFADLDRYIVAAQSASARAAALTHRMLAFSRRQTLDPKATDLNGLVSGMEELIRRTMGPAVHVEVVERPSIWIVLVDAHQLENALLNLCINARDAMPGGGRLTIETGNREIDGRVGQIRDIPAGQYVSLSVSDSGTGMAPEVIARAFDPFFTTKPIGQGTGLGLSMIYGFARQSGGQVRIHSELGRGTTVTVYLPRHSGAVAPLMIETDSLGLERSGRGESVLVVDDEPTVRMMVAEVLQELGYRAMEATDGASGLKVLESNERIDLLVTDVGLPGGMNGRQMADAGRAIRPGLRVLFITGYAESAVVGHGHLEPGMHVLTKPFGIEVMAARIKEVLSQTA